ncbi:MAG: GNAT family N-acetyltransferase [Candidatus Schekmanbacteria bacterium]|nr:GNAT family N-acetyltransferase [Candidatus Schekmanbacteria bacterium]
MADVFVFEPPHEGLKDSYRSLIHELDERGEPLIPFPLGFPNADFPGFLRRLAACSRGEGIPPGYVAHSTYWLARGGEVLGVSNLRHVLTEKARRDGGNIGFGVRPSARRQGVATELLRRTLAAAQRMGIPAAWLTCDRRNEASRRTILRNGGIFVSEELIPERGSVVQRYRIDLAVSGAAPRELPAPPGDPASAVS